MSDFPPYTTERSHLIDHITVILEDPMTTQDEITTLARRLEDGYARIDEAEARGDYTHYAAWENFWLKLLHEYETLCREADQRTQQGMPL